MYVKAATFAKHYNISPQTLRRWADAGKINFKWSQGGIRLYKLPANNDIPGAGTAVQKKKVVYARVSSAKQKDDLQRQTDFLNTKFPDHQLITDIGSGVNWKRKGLLALLDAANSGDLEELVVASRDRLCRFAFDLLDYVFKQRGVKLVVLECAADMSAERELSDDLLSIVQVFCCRRNGRRRYRLADAEDQAEPQQSPETDSKQVC